MLDNEYDIKNKILHHIDLYRLNSFSDCLALDIMKLFDSKNIVLVEWSEVLGDNLPNNYIKIKLKLNENSDNRRIEISIHPQTLQERLDKWIESVNKEFYITYIEKY